MEIAEKIRDWVADFKDKPLKDKILTTLPYVLCIFFFTRIVELYRLCGKDLYRFFRNIQYIYKVFPPQFIASDLCIGMPIGFLVVWLVKWTNKIHRKNMRFGEEYGSAR